MLYIITTASKKASITTNKLLSNTEILTKTVFVEKSMISLEKSTLSKASAHEKYAGIKRAAHMSIATSLYKSNFQKTEKFATNNLSEFLNIINTPY